MPRSDRHWLFGMLYLILSFVIGTKFVMFSVILAVLGAIFIVKSIISEREVL
jgi:hypothetical protein